MIKLFPADERAFDSNGIGVLSDAVSGFVTEERNGAFELEMQYPTTGAHFSEIALQSIIYAKPAPLAPPQPFRIYQITKPMGGVVSILARHISYDLSGVPVLPFTADTAPAAMRALTENAAIPCPFTFSTDKSTAARMTLTVPRSIRAQMGGVAGSVLDVYGGEWGFDGYDVRLYAHRGQNRGVSIRYGKNLTDIQQEKNCANVHTGVLPFWAGQEGETVTLPEKVVKVEGTFPFDRVLTVDFSSEFQQAPTADQLRERAARYIKANKIGIPKVNISLSFVQLDQTEEYKGAALLERVSLCDEVNVVFPALDIDTTAKVIKTKYNILLNRMESVELGDVRANFADTVAQQGGRLDAQQGQLDAQREELKKKPGEKEMADAIKAATDLITGATGGFVGMLDTDGDGKPDTLYAADSDDPKKMVNVWRWNYKGWGASEKGFNGPFKMAATLGSGMNADFITAGKVNTNVIEIMGTGTFLDGTSLVIQHGALGKGANTTIDTGGLRLYDKDGQLLGGTIRTKSGLVSAVQTIMNPRLPNFRFGIAPYDFEGEEMGVHLFFDDVEQVGIFAYNGGARIKSYAEDGVKRRLEVIGPAGELNLGESGVGLSSDGGISFSFSGYDLAGGYHNLSFTAQDVWTMLAKSGAFD